MKKSYLFSVLFVAILILSSCSGKDPEPEKSKACDIETFNAGGKDWAINGLNITTTFSKGTNVSNLSPTIRVSDKAKISPASGTVQDFSDNREIKYTVTAEDGKTEKVYTAKATVSASN